MAKVIVDQAASWSRSSLNSPNPPRTPTFLAVIWRDQATNCLYASRLPNRVLNDFCEQDLDQTHLYIPPNHYQPIWDPYISRYNIDVPQTNVELFLKTPRLIGYDGSMGIAQKVRQEICILEQLRKNPHPNVCEYFGCEVDSTAGLVTGVYTRKYHWSLSALLQGYTPYDSNAYIPRPTLHFDTLVRGIGAGIRHLHAMGLAHNDISPRNIMIDEYGNPVIIDFDNCAAFGQACRPGTPGFTNFSKVADPRNDIHAMHCLLAYLRQRFGHVLPQRTSQRIPTQMIAVN